MEDRALQAAPPPPPAPAVVHVRHSQELPALEPKQVEAMVLMIDGWPDTRIAKRMGVDRRTILRWRNLPAFVERFGEHVRMVEQAGSQHLAALASVALAELEDQLVHPDPKTRYYAATALLKLALRRRSASGHSGVPRPQDG